MDQPPVEFQSTNQIEAPLWLALDTARLGTGFAKLNRADATEPQALAPAGFAAVGGVADFSADGERSDAIGISHRGRIGGPACGIGSGASHMAERAIVDKYGSANRREPYGRCDGDAIAGEVRVIGCGRGCVGEGEGAGVFAFGGSADNLVAGDFPMADSDARAGSDGAMRGF